MIDFNQSLQIAKSAALLAGDFLLKAQGSDLKILLNQDRDLKLQLDIDTESVLEAAGTKWNFLPFRPGLVGGHCIGVCLLYTSPSPRD